MRISSAFSLFSGSARSFLTSCFAKWTEIRLSIASRVLGGEGLFNFRVVDADTLFDFRVVAAVTLFDDFIGVFRLAHADVMFLGRNLLDLYVRCLDADSFVFLPTELDIYT